MDEKSKKVLTIITIIATIILLLYLLLTKRTHNNISPSSSPSPTSSPSSPPPTSTPSSPSSSSSPIQVTSFVIADGCSGPYCWGMVTFNSSIGGILTQVNTVYSNGTSYSWTGNYQVNPGTNTIWLSDCECLHLSCDPPGQITALVFVIMGNQYTVPVTPTVGNPLATGTPSYYSSQTFIGSSCMG